MLTEINYIVSCANRKVRAPPEYTQYGRLDNPAPYTWVRNLSRAEQVFTTQARDLYQGDYWTQVKGRERDGNVLIASAGYGWLSMSARVTAYAATLSPGYADSIGDRRWFRKVNAEFGKLELVRDIFPYGPLIVVMSPSYLNQITLPDYGKDMLIVTSKNTGGPYHTRTLVVPSNLQNYFGGSLASLYIRAAAMIGESGSLDIDYWRSWMKSKAAEVPPLNRPIRNKKTDEEIKEYIAENYHCAWSQLLVTYRRSGNACLQARFKYLWEEVHSGVYTYD